MRINVINNLTTFMGLNISKEVMKKILKSPKGQKINAMKEIELADSLLSQFSEDVCVFKPTKKNNFHVRAEENYFHPQKEIKVRAKKFIKNPSKYICKLFSK